MPKIVICKECGEEKVHYAKRMCRKCYTQEWNKQNKGKRQRSHRSWDLKNRKKNNKTHQNWRKRNPKKNKKIHQNWKEKNLDYMQTWYVENPDYAYNWRLENPDYMYNWRINHPKRHQEIHKKSEAKRRALKHNALIEPFNLGEWLESQKPFICFYCEKPTMDTYHLDHLIPLSRGGPHALWNLAITCPRCNLKKYTDLPWEFLPEKFSPNMFTSGQLAQVNQSLYRYGIRD